MSRYVLYPLLISAIAMPCMIIYATSNSAPPAAVSLRVSATDLDRNYTHFAEGA